MAKSLKSFWSACEKLASAAVMKQWEKTIPDQDVLAASRKLLVPTDQPAIQYPCTNEHWCMCSHEVVTHKDGTMVAICTCDDGECDVIPVTKDDLIVYQMDFSKILSGVARAAGLVKLEPIAVDIHEPVHFANLDAGGNMIPAYFAMVGCGCLDREKLLGLLIGSYDPFILFTLSPFDFHINSPNPWYRDSRLMLCLADQFTTDGDRIAVSPALGQAVGDFAKRVQGYVKAQQVQAAHCDCVFEASSDYHIIVLRGQRLPPLSDLQADVVRILHAASGNGQPEMSYDAISCAVADMHAEEIGFEPPSKMSQVFRSGDKRGDVVLCTKPGYYRLNI